MYEKVYRDADGERIPGKSRHVFARNGDIYYLKVLTVYADGLVDCFVGGNPLMTIDKLRSHFDNRRLRTAPPDGADIQVLGLGQWRFEASRDPIDAEMLLGELCDIVDQLNGRPDSVGRCLQAIDRYAADRTEDNRLEIRAAYYAIPRHLRRRLNDQDLKDRPIRTLIAEIPGPNPDGRVVTEQRLAEAVAHFVELGKLSRERSTFGYDVRQAPTLILENIPYARRWPDPPGVEVLTPDYPAEFAALGHTYPSITHGILAQSASTGEWHDRIAGAEGTKAARAFAEDAPLREDWGHRRLAVASELLRRKFAQHPALAEILLATGDGRISYRDIGVLEARLGGSNWYGRLLEVIRSELALARR